MSIQSQVMSMRQELAAAAGASPQQCCRTDESKCKDPTTTFRIRKMNTLQAQRRLLLSAPACLHRYQAKYCSEILSPTSPPEGGIQLYNCSRWETRQACRQQL